MRKGMYLGEKSPKWKGGRDAKNARRRLERQKTRGRSCKECGAVYLIDRTNEGGSRSSKWCKKCCIASCICVGCKNKFFIKRKDLNDGRGVFCNKRCYLKNVKLVAVCGEKHGLWKGGVTFQQGYSCRYTKAYKERKLAADGFFTQGEWLGLKIKYNFMCLCCKKTEPEIKLTVDHIIPLSRGGRNSVENIQPLCHSCNSIKNVKTINFIEQYANT